MQSPRDREQHIHCINHEVRFYVEERLLESPDEVEFAWMFTDEAKAEEHLLDVMKNYGEERLYGYYKTIG